MHRKSLFILLTEPYRRTSLLPDGRPEKGHETRTRKELYRKFSNSESMYTKVLENLACYNNIQMLVIPGNQMFPPGLDYPTSRQLVPTRSYWVSKR